MAKGRAVRKWASLGFFAVSLTALLGAAALFWSGYQYFREEFPEANRLKRQFPVMVYQGKDSSPKVRWERGRPGTWVPLDGISRAALGAVVVSEDWAFYQHKGFDPNQIKEAIREDLEAGAFVRGASTITQQVAKNVFLERDKNLWRKVKELWLALELEQDVGKRRILETYFNIAEWGEGLFGIKAAAQHYFKKEPSQLTPKEGAFLAMLLPSPKKYSVSFRKGRLTEYARETIESILGKMVQAKYLEKEQLKQELESRLSFETADAEPEEAEPFLEKDENI
jgi:monofunctional biosynthetic peptidoglycan transglycosylase